MTENMNSEGSSSCCDCPKDTSLEETELWIKEKLLPRVLSANRNNYFKDVLLVNSRVEAMEGNKDNWASMMFAVFMTLQDISKCENKSLQVLIKLMPEIENRRVKMHSDLQFSNEIHLYSVCLNHFKCLSSKMNISHLIMRITPKCYYTSMQKPIPGHPKLDDGIIVMEDLRVLQYKLGNRTFLDLKHCTIAMEIIGSFHALSYLSKERDPKYFEKHIVEPILETNYAKDNMDLVRLIFPIAQHRVLDYLDKHSATDHSERTAGVERLRAIATRDSYDLFKELAKPCEPLAVLCHGDFLRNNVLFRYEDGVPVDMKLIDFQTIRYASPAIDLSLFICMNTNRELRAAHFQQLLRAYHRSLRSTLSSLLEVEEEQLPEKYNFDAFMEDFRKHALYGYLITIDFMPWMMAEEDELAEYVNLFMNDMFTPKFSEMARVIGGEATTMVNAELAQDLIDFGCI